MDFAVVLGADKYSKNQSLEQKTLTSNISKKSSMHSLKLSLQHVLSLYDDVKRWRESKRI
ncbi:hypothetical protein L1283_005736 [Sphingobacterium sp. HSC-15S19]